MFSACGYFPLWIRIKNNFTWFTENKKRILQAVKKLFRVPEIVSCDPDYETVIFMGVSFGRTDLLVYVLVPLCTRKHVRSSLGRNDVCLSLEQLGISGVYFGRKSGKSGYDDDLSITSFSSVNESMQGDLHVIEKAEDRQILHSSKRPAEVEKHAHYNGTAKSQNQEFLDKAELHTAQSTSQSGSPQDKAGKDLKVMRASMGYIDSAGLASKEDQPIRVVRPKIMYIDQSIPSTIAVQDSPMIDRAVFDREHENIENIVTESTDMVQESPQNYMDLYKEGEPNALQNLSHEKKERIQADELDGLIVSEVKYCRDEDWKAPDELMRLTNQKHTNHGMGWAYDSIMTNNMNGRNWTEQEKSEHGKRQMSVMDFSLEDKNYDDEKRSQPQSSTSKSGGKKMYTSTAIFQVNMGNKSTNSKEQPRRFVNDDIYQPETMASLNMSQPGFNTKELSAKGRHSPPWQAENGYSSWYKDTATEDYYKAMIPEPEPGNTQQLYQLEDVYQRKMVTEEETATPRNDCARNMHGGGSTPLYTPPSSFRDATPAGRKLVMVKTGLVDTPKQQPFIVSMDHHSMAQNDWESPRVESNKLRQFPKTAAMPSDNFENNSAHYNFNEYSRRNPDRPDRFVNGNQQQPLTFAKSESELLSDYADSVFTDHDDTGRRFAEVPPPYIAPPDYMKTVKRSEGKFSDDSVSTGSSFCYLLSLIILASLSTTQGKTLEIGFKIFWGLSVHVVHYHVHIYGRYILEV